MPHFRTSCQRPLGPGVPLLAVRRFVASAHAMLLPRRLLGALRPRRGSATCRAASPWLHPTAKHPIGARSCASDATPAAPPRYDAAIISLRAASFGQPAGVAEARALAAARLVVFGEIHSMPPCIELLQRTAASMMSDAAAAGGTLHVVLEHLNFEQQPLLDAYAAKSIDLPQLLARYEEGPEGHDLAPYEALFELAREPPAAAAAGGGGRVRLHAGFIPRSYARTVMRDGVEAALAAARDKGYVSMTEDCGSTEAHYAFFESLLTGRSPHDDSKPPSDQYRKMFPAQVIKDAAMAHRVSCLVAAAPPADRFLVVCGVGHSGYSHGVPERLLAAQPQLAHGMVRIWSLPAAPTADLRDAAAIAEILEANFGAAGATDPAELCLLYKEVEQPDGVALCPKQQPDATDAEAVKAATAAAYNQVGETAHIKGNASRAVALLRRMHYSAAEVAAAGADAANWQGVGCPHRHARLSTGESVADLGSGLGIDSFIAAAAVGEAGRVVGIDIARQEVRHANGRAAARGLSDHVRFEEGDLEKLPLPSSSVDAIISNGAFCLAPDKPAAFREALRVLKPGGRVAIALSTIKAASLQPGVEWPLCMRMFIGLDELQPLVEQALT